jgi:hypothetical protein
MWKQPAQQEASEIGVDMERSEEIERHRLGGEQVPGAPELLDSAACGDALGRVARDRSVEKVLARISRVAREVVAVRLALVVCADRFAETFLPPPRLMEAHSGGETIVPVVLRTVRILGRHRVTVGPNDHRPAERGVWSP